MYEKDMLTTNKKIVYGYSTLLLYTAEIEQLFIEPHINEILFRIPPLQMQICDCSRENVKAITEHAMFNRRARVKQQ